MEIGTWQWSVRGAGGGELVDGWKGMGTRSVGRGGECNHAMVYTGSGGADCMEWCCRGGDGTIIAKASCSGYIHLQTTRSLLCRQIPLKPVLLSANSGYRIVQGANTSFFTNVFKFIV